MECCLMDKIKKGLGRGLSSLIGETKVEMQKNQLPISDLVPNKYQPRKIFDETNLEDLTNSIKERGVIQPIIVRKSTENNSKFEIIAGKSRSHIANSLRLLTLPDEVIKLIEDEKLTAGHAKILVGLENAIFVANKVVEKRLSVRQTENLFRVFKKKKIKGKSKDINILALEKEISDKIGLRVIIKNRNKNKGSIEFLYNGSDQLNRLIEIIKKNY